MISSKFIFDKANQVISGGNLTEQQMTHLSSIETLSNSSVLSVATLADLPNVVSNLGSLVYVVAENKYYYSDGASWNINYSSEFVIAARVAYGWGTNGQGQVGDGTTTNRSSPVTVIGGITNWSQLSSGNLHQVGITSTGIAYAWGNNYNGQLGDGTTVSKSSPVTILGGITNWSRISPGVSHTLGVTTTGIAYAWGQGFAGRLGDGTTTQRTGPVTVIGGITNWTQLSAGDTWSLGVTSTGIAYAWGFGGFGQLGDGTTVSKLSPVTVIGGITNWSQVSASAVSSGIHSLGLTSTGIAYAWGSNTNGRLGDGTTTGTSSPVTVIGGITNWSQVSAGGSHSIGLTSTGIVYGWGLNSSGQLGDGTATSRLSPVTVVGGITNWSQVSAGSAHTLGLTSTGIAYAWGNPTGGRLGDGTTTFRSSPVTVVGGITNWTQVSAGGSQSIALNTITKGF